MKIIVVGAGGREHAIAWRLSTEGNEVVCMPGNPGMAELGRCVAVKVDDIEGLVAACVEESPDLVVVGPEAPLAAGLVDRLGEKQIPAFGASAKASRIEASKAYAKDVMARAGVPTATFVVVHDAASLDAAIDELGGDVAIKADGLAAGKGVVVCSSAEEARAAGRQWLAKGPVVVEERLSGPELSIIAVTDGKGIVLLPPARDHKRLLDGDQGPNTGGMGALCPVPVPVDMLSFAREQVIRPVLHTMAVDGAPFSGVLYAGLMLDPRGPRVLEFNARFGDPEAQVLLTALSPEVKLGELMLEVTRGRLGDKDLPAKGASCCVVLAAPGYPEAPQVGEPIEGIDRAVAGGALVFHAGTRVQDGRLLTSGGRVLNVVAQGSDLREARDKALAAAGEIRSTGFHYRRDIGTSTVG